MKKISALTLAGLMTCTCGFAAEVHDNFYWLGQINKATCVINTDQGLVSPEQGQRFAKSIDQVLKDGSQKGAARPKLVITFEPLLIKACGSEEITMLHAGRSSQDMLSTVKFVQTREELINLAQELNLMQASLYKLAKDNENTLIPNYTNGVAAQPNSLAHYLLGYAYAFERDLERLNQYYTRLNRSPMGAMVLNGTGWPLNRDRMASYLGFDGLAYNTYDAGQVYTAESPVEAASCCNTIALHMTSFIEEIMQQYAQPHPWMLLKEGGNNTYVSSAMPQKRNPGLLNRVRTQSSTILAEGTGALFRAHNIPAGMADGRSGSDKLLKDTAAAVKGFNQILNNLVIDPERSLAELDLDWTCSQEIADQLMLKYNVPFRTGHHFASEIVGYARPNNVTPSTFTYAKAQEIYAKLAANDKEIPQVLPLTEEEFKACLNPASIVARRAVKGGPQAKELEIMFKQIASKNKAHTNWVDEIKAQQQNAEAKLNADFAKLLQK